MVEEAICDAFYKKLHLIAVSYCIDIKKAFEMVWRERVITLLQNASIDGHMLEFIKNFLRERFIQVKANGILSTCLPIKNGVPQGPVLSVTLFLVAINDIVKNINLPVKCCLFADDLTIFCTGKNYKITQEILQKSLNKLQTWSTTTGFNFSASKSEYIIFSRKTNPLTEFNLELKGTKIQETDNMKLLGLTFDKRLNWNHHLVELKNSTSEKINLIKTLAARNWGADQKTLLNTFKALILSKLDYGSIIYGSSKKTEILNTIQNKGLKIATGAYHTSPTNSIL